MRAVILGGTGAIGGAVAGGLAGVTGRDPGSMPQELVSAGVRPPPQRCGTAAAVRDGLQPSLTRLIVLRGGGPDPVAGAEPRQYPWETASTLCPSGSRMNTP